MITFRKYQHIERFGTKEVENIQFGECLVFPKIDGTNDSLWFDNGIKAGSRNRELSLDNDNAGFYKAHINDERFIKFFEKYPNYKLFGEWLKPHSLKTYRKDAWDKFYIFDVIIEESEEKFKYLTYEEYKPILEAFNIDYIPCLKVIKNGSYEDFVNIMNQNNYLIEDGKGIGEGIVIKRYDFVNEFRRTVWAKIVTSEFKEAHIKLMGSPKVEKSVLEENIVNKFFTPDILNKIYANMTLENDWRSERINELLNRCYYELIKEEMWNIVKEFKHPIINFKVLNHFLINKIKEYKKELF